ncbi:cytochrome P450 [Cubamyces menziesii]|nr:cytochrome P450 [Cubamyces menziesii]
MTSLILAPVLTKALFSSFVGPLLLIALAFRACPHRDFVRLAEKYGPVFTLQYGSRRLVVITNVEAAVDIMVKQSHNLADRPQAVVAGELIGGGLRIVSMHVGDRLRKYRTALHATLQPQSAAKYEPLQMQNARNFILDLLDEPDQFIDHAKRYAASLALGITYGKTTRTSYSDPEVKRINTSMDRIAYAIRPGSYIVDSYPFLKHIPWFTSELKKYYQEDMALFHTQLQTVKERILKNEAHPCFALSLLERQEELGLTGDELAYLAGSMFSGGAGTTAGVLPIVIMAAAHHPQLQARVRAQLDEVVGCNRLPTFADRDMLTEVCAFVQEVYRWRPLTPTGSAFVGVPHRATKDVFWKGYVIPAGTEVYACHWAIGRDSEVYPDPGAFKPERWLDEQGKMRDDLKFFNWGFGRRICPGMHVAERSIFINTALMLWAFEISEDPAHPIDTMAMRDSAIAPPEPFVVRFKSRIMNLREKILSHVE